MSRFHKFVYHKILRSSRLRTEAGIINVLPGKTILDVGYFDGRLKEFLRPDFEYYGIDPAPEKEMVGMPRVGIEDFSTEKKFDIVNASSILEHVTDPVLAIKKIKELSRGYVCIGVPYEPYYTISRFFIPEREHLWTVHPQALAFYLGNPILEKFIHFKRCYYAVFKIN